MGKNLQIEYTIGYILEPLILLYCKTDVISERDYESTYILTIILMN